MNDLAIDLLRKGVGSLEFNKRNCSQHIYAQLQRDIDELKKSIWCLEQYKTTMPPSEIDEAIGIMQAALDAPEVDPVLEVIRMPDHWVGGRFYDSGGSYISEGAISKLPIGTKLYAAPQERKPQEPVAWAIQACSRMWTGEFAEYDAEAEARRCGGTCYAYPLFTKDTP